MFNLLHLIFNLEEKLLVDTRPRYPLRQIHNWLTKTDNIILSEQGFKLIDTRWFWETQKINILSNGLVISGATLMQTKFCLKKLLNHN